MIKTVDLSSFAIDTKERYRPLKILTILKQQSPFTQDVFTYDNTNTIEGNFNVVKGRVPLASPRLLDVYNAVFFTETAALARRNPVSPDVPETLEECLLNVVSPDVLNVMTMEGVESFIGNLVKTELFVRNGVDGAGVVTEIERSVRECKVIEHFRWMPETWVMSQQNIDSSHEVTNITDNSIAMNDVVLFLEPYFDQATRSIPVFKLINDTMM